MPDEKPVSASASWVVKRMEPSHANAAGKVHGGTILKLCDEVAAIAAMRHSRRRVVTAGIDQMTFEAPVDIGELLILKASVNAAWTSSMEVGVRVEAENLRTGEVRHASTAYFTMVALDDDGNKAEVPDARAETDDERRRHAAAQERQRGRQPG
jgi:acyl-CoA hydrolase